MTEREGAAYHQAGHAVMAYLRNVDFESVVIICRQGHYLGDLFECNYESSVPDDLDQAEVQSYVDTSRLEIGLAGPFAQCLHVGGFTPGREATETHRRAIDAYLKGSNDEAVLYALAGHLFHLNFSLGEDLMDAVTSSPYPRIILFDVSDHWHLVEAVAAALVARNSLSQAAVHQIIQVIQAKEN